MGKTAFDFDKIRQFPKGTPFIMLPKDLIESDAWNGMKINCRRLIDRLHIENMAHAGKENGNLIVTYDQFEETGINRRYINAAIKEAEERGLILVEYGQYKGKNQNRPNKFTLTFFKIKTTDPQSSNVWYTEPTNEWRRFTDK